MPPVITSLLETDLYKFTMWQAMLHRHPATQARYRFHCRNEPEFPLAELADKSDRRAYYHCVLVLLRHADDPQPLIAEASWHGVV